MMTAHIDWFDRILTVAMQLYFRQGCEYTSIEEVTPPDDGWLEDMTGRQEITFGERAAIMLALMPHIRPQALDIFLQKTRTSTANIPNSVAGKGGRTEASCLPVKPPHLSSLEKI